MIALFADRQPLTWPDAFAFAALCAMCVLMLWIIVRNDK